MGSTNMKKELTAPIFDVQRFSIHDGPGIRSLVFFKGCNLSCHWCQNPESQQAKPQLAFYAQRCNQSLDCLNACTQDAINPNGFRVDYDKCSLCLKCVDACAHDALQLMGETLTVDSLFSRIMADKVYYQSSQGGVTFTGGEATLYPKFLEQLVDKCFNEGIHITLETCGSYAHDRWQETFKQIQLIYFDLKIIDEQKHIVSTGSKNQNILSNARLLAQQGYPVEFRLALVPGYTDVPENLEAIVQFLHSVKQGKLHLLSYHNMGESKIDLIQGKQKHLNIENYEPQNFQEIKQWFIQQGIEVLDHQ